MRTISLRRFRDSIPEVGEPVDVQRRDKDGNFQMLGRWTPFVLSVGDDPLEPLAEAEDNAYRAYRASVGAEAIEEVKRLKAAVLTGLTFREPAAPSFNSRGSRPVPK